MLDLLQARSVAERHLERLRQSGEDVVIDPRHTVTRPGLFAFVYNSRAFVNQGDQLAALVGNGPLIVDRETGELHERNTAYPVEHHVREYEQSRRVP